MFYDHDVHARRGHASRLLSVYWRKETASFFTYHFPASGRSEQPILSLLSEFILPASLPRYKKVLKLFLRVCAFVYLIFFLRNS
jgi:hypothetical protein